MIINVIKTEDWEGLYLDGILNLEGHSLDLSRVLDLLVETTIKEVVYTYMETNEDFQSFPKYLQDLDNGIN